MRDYRGNRKHLNPWLRAGEVAEMLKYSTASVRNYVRSGLLRYEYNMSKQCVFIRDMVEEFKAKMLNQPTPTKDRRVFYVRSSSNDKNLVNSHIDLFVAKFGEPLRIYCNVGFSGLNENRKGLLSMLKDATNYHFDILYATHPDRIIRFDIGCIGIFLAQNNISLDFFILSSIMVTYPMAKARGFLLL